MLYHRWSSSSVDSAPSRSSLDSTRFLPPFLTPRRLFVTPSSSSIILRMVVCHREIEWQLHMFLFVCLFNSLPKDYLPDPKNPSVQRKCPEPLWSDHSCSSARSPAESSSTQSAGTPPGDWESTALFRARCSHPRSDSLTMSTRSAGWSPPQSQSSRISGKWRIQWAANIEILRKRKYKQFAP